jgi:hypothetical protein
MSDRRIADFMARGRIDQVLERLSECSGNGLVLGNHYTFIHFQAMLSNSLDTWKK